jgi:hypothetical protein
MPSFIASRPSRGTGSRQPGYPSLSPSRGEDGTTTRLEAAEARHGLQLKRRSKSAEDPLASDDTTAQLKGDIDAGRTGDKVAAPDPAMAPLGTDEEAAGTPPQPEAIALARRLESARPHEHGSRPGLGHAWILVAFIVVLAVAMVGFMFVF